MAYKNEFSNTSTTYSVEKFLLGVSLFTRHGFSRFSANIYHKPDYDFVVTLESKFWLLQRNGLQGDGLWLNVNAPLPLLAHQNLEKRELRDCYAVIPFLERGFKPLCLSRSWFVLLHTCSESSNALIHEVWSDKNEVCMKPVKVSSLKLTGAVANRLIPDVGVSPEWFHFVHLRDGWQMPRPCIRFETRCSE